jgi:hypothetical protein
MSQLWPVLLGAALALVSGYVGARWQARFAAEQQRGLLRYEQQIALYVDVLAECRRKRDWLDRIAGLANIGPYEKKITVYQPAVPIGARLDLLGTPAMVTARAEMDEAEIALDWDLNNDSYEDRDQYAPVDYPGRLRMLAAVDALDGAVREALDGSSVPARRKGWFRVLGGKARSGQQVG